MLELLFQNRGGGWRGDRKRNQNKKDGKKDDRKNDKKEGAENETEKSKDGEEEKSGDKDGPYSGVPMKLMSCFVCCKEMWDGESMKKHLKGILPLINI